MSNVTPQHQPKDTGMLLPGTMLGRFQIVRKLAQGGMAEVYLAKQIFHNSPPRYVALKRVLPEFAGQREILDMFMDEARIAATLQHPNVVELVEVGKSGRETFLAMEFLHGQDVRTIMRTILPGGGKIPLQDILQIMDGLAAGLHYAHQKNGADNQPLNIVHRDVTPQNIIVTYDGDVKLVDFGVAKAANKVTVTRVGTIKGKLSYMSPEQCRGEVLDSRSDIFPLGILLFEMTLGKKLFKGQHDLETMQMICDRPVVAPLRLDPSFPPALEAVILKALKKKREERYQTVQEFRDALAHAAKTSQLQPSRDSLRALMQKSFAGEIADWKKAQEQGTSFGEYLETRIEPDRSLTGRSAMIPVARSGSDPSIQTPLPAFDDDDGVATTGDRGMPIWLMAALGAMVLCALIFFGLRFTQAKGPGVVELKTAVPCDLVVDGMNSGQTPARLQLQPGPHTIVVKNSKTGGQKTLKVNMVAGETITPTIPTP